MKPGMVRRAAELESDTADALRGQRVQRLDLFEVATDVIVTDFPSLAVDAKYRARHAHHKFMAEIERKYGGVPVLVTKHRGQVGAFATVPLKVLGRLLDIARAAGQTELDRGGGEVRQKAEGV